MKKDLILVWVGIIDLGFWLFDTFSKIFIQHLPYRMLWYSSMGLLLTSIGILRKNSFLITAMFCALLFIESLWLISFFSYPFIHKNLTPIAAYAFDPQYPKFEFYTTLYHILIVPSLILSLLITKKVHFLGWLGASLFTSLLIILSFLLVPVGDNVNCVQKPCEVLFSALYSYPKYQATLIAVSGLTVFVYLPFNLVAMKLGKITAFKPSALSTDTAREV